jgi:hypothetical protein
MPSASRLSFWKGAPDDHATPDRRRTGDHRGELGAPPAGPDRPGPAPQPPLVLQGPPRYVLLYKHWEADNEWREASFFPDLDAFCKAAASRFKAGERGTQEELHDLLTWTRIPFSVTLTVNLGVTT